MKNGPCQGEGDEDRSCQDEEMKNGPCQGKGMKTDLVRSMMTHWDAEESRSRPLSHHLPVQNWSRNVNCFFLQIRLSTLTGSVSSLHSEVIHPAITFTDFIPSVVANKRPVFLGRWRASPGLLFSNRMLTGHLKL